MSIGSSGGGVARAWGTAVRSTGRRTGATATATNGGSDPTAATATATNGGVGDEKIRQQFVSARAVCLRLERMGRGRAARDLYSFDL